MLGFIPHTYEIAIEREIVSKARPLPAAEYLFECLHCNAELGELIWKKRPASHFDTEQAHQSWNKTKAGARACNNIFPYRLLYLDGRQLRAHRVIWKMTNGTEPEVVDHINGVSRDNRIANLRGTTQADNNRNRPNSHYRTKLLRASGAIA